MKLPSFFYKSLFCVIFFCGCACQKQNGKDFRKYYIFSGNETEIQDNMKKEGFHRIQIIYRKQIDSDNDGKFEKNIYLDQLKKLFPDKNTRGVLVLDWEGKVFQILKKSEIHGVVFKETIMEMTSLLNLTHKIRPNIKVGYYGLPLRNRTQFTKEYIDRHQAFEPIFQASDVLYPSLYDMSEGSPSLTNRDGYLYAKNNTEFSLRIAEKYNKQVFPFIWHRFHPQAKNVSLQQIPINEFKAQLKGIGEAEYKKRGINGIVWWRSDNLFFDNEKKALIQDAQKNGSLQKLIKANTLKYSGAMDGMIKAIRKRKDSL